MIVDRGRIEAAILEQLGRVGPGKTLAAVDIARHLALGSEWNALMAPIRQVVVELAVAGRLVIYRKGRPVDPKDFKGVWRMGLPHQD